MKNLLTTHAMTRVPERTSSQEMADFKNALRSFHEDDRGDNENLGRMLVLGLILVPIVIILALFGQDIAKEVNKQWNDVIGNAGKIKKG